MSENSKTPRTPKAPVQKKEYSLDNFKDDFSFNDEKSKPLEWYEYSPAFKTNTGLPGAPKGYVTLHRGFSNTGKSTAIYEAIVSAQRAGDFIVIVDVENNIDFSRLEKMGYDMQKHKYTIYLDTVGLTNKFAKVRDKDATNSTIEDMAAAIEYFLKAQETGRIPANILFAIDSIGVLDCIKSTNAKEKDTSNNNMWNAGAYESAFKGLLNFRIPATRKESSPYTSTIVAVQKIWLEPQLIGQPIVRHKGGEAFYFASRLIYHHGGKKTAGVSKWTATRAGVEYYLGIESAIHIEKNHIEEYGGIGYSGNKLISTPHGFIGNDKASQEEYKKAHIDDIRNALKLDDITPEDINFENNEIMDFSVFENK